MKRSALHVMDGGGVVRGFRYWGMKLLPQEVHKQKVIHRHGEYVISVLLPRRKPMLVVLNGLQLLDNAL